MRQSFLALLALGLMCISGGASAEDVAAPAEGPMSDPAKMEEMMKLGMPGEGHAVLTVRTKDSDYVLDNLNSKILPWNKTEYRYLKRQSTMHAGRWTDIQDNRDIVGAIK